MEHIYKSYGQAVVLQDFSYAFTPGGITCIMGESGAGKTTLLRLLMGLEKADSGIITGFDKVSAVFQENRLIEHLNAVENTALVIKDRNAGKCAYEQLLQLLPKEALVAGEHLDGPITIEVPVLDNNFNYWYVGVGIKYNLSSLFKNNKKVRQAKLNMRKAQEEYSLAQEQIENGVQANYVNFLTSFTDLRTQEKSVELADQNYNVTSNRYKNDLALLTDMLDASNMKLSADLNLVNARINVVYSFYKMKYITHTL